MFLLQNFCLVAFQLLKIFSNFFQFFFQFWFWIFQLNLKLYYYYCSCFEIIQLFALKNWRSINKWKIYTNNAYIYPHYVQTAAAMCNEYMVYILQVYNWPFNVTYLELYVIFFPTIICIQVSVSVDLNIHVSVSIE